jgi:hypothetical protein
MIVSQKFNLHDDDDADADDDDDDLAICNLRLSRWV